MHLENFFAAHHIRVRHNNLTVKTAGTQQCRIQHIRPVGCGNQNHPFIRFEAIHLDQHLVERLFAFVITAAKTSAAMPPDRVNFVDKDDTWGIFLALFKHIAHTAGTNTNEHLNKIRSGDGKERHIGLASDGAGQQCLTGTRRANKQHTFWNFATKSLELARVFQKFNNFFKLGFGLINAGNIFKSHAPLMLGKQLCPGFAKAHRAARSTLHLPHEENPDTDE